jgi:Na+/H+-translocating membrane pyrophosphatase
MKVIAGNLSLISFVTGIIVTGIPVSISLINTGSAWDNSKKIVECNFQTEFSANGK